MSAPAPCIYLTGERGDVGSLLARLYEQAGWRVIPLFEAKKASGGRLLHMAAKSPPASPEELERSNQAYLARCVERAVDLGLDEVVFFSAMSVYGSQDAEGLSEGQEPVSPDAYGRSKLWGEQYLKNAPIRALCLRLPAMLGMKNTTNFPCRCLEKLARGQDVEITNAGRMFNNFLDVEGLFGFLSGLGLKKNWDVVNLASGDGLSLGRVVGIIAEAAGSSSRIVENGRPAPFFNISTEKARLGYGFRPPEPRAALARWAARRLAGRGG